MIKIMNIKFSPPKLSHDFERVVQSDMLKVKQMFAKMSYCLISLAWLNYWKGMKDLN